MMHACPRNPCMSTPIPISLAPAPARSVEVLGSLSELAALRAEWWALWHALQQPIPFLSPSWLLCWARHYAPDRTRAIAVREHGVLVALLPFFNWRGELLLRSEERRVGKECRAG